MATARPIRADEREDLLELYRHLNPDDPPVEDDPAAGEQWTALLEDDDVTVFVVEHEDRLVATCLLSVTPNLTRGARPFALIENVVTRESERGEGFGRLCLEAAIERAEERDCYKVMLLTGTDREWKLDFYESVGFDRERKTGLELDLR